MVCAPQLADVRPLLAGVPLFRGISAAGLQRLVAATCQSRFVRGGAIFRKGEQCNGLYFVVYGRVKVFFLSQQGSEKILDIIDPGSTFCEATVFGSGDYQVHAESLSECLLLHVAKAAIIAELAHDLCLATSVIGSLSQKLLERSADIETYSLHSGRQRVVQHLLGEAAESNEHWLRDRASNTCETFHRKGEAVLPRMVVNLLPRKCDVASRLNLTHEHFSRILHELSSCGLIGIDKRTVLIRDVERLRRVLETDSTLIPA
jgi:CRP-like cAMP-binding protein